MKIIGLHSESVPKAVQFAKIQIKIDITKLLNKIVMRRRKVIQLPKGAADRICKHLMIGKTTLYSALNYTSNSEDAKHTREVAISEYGGVEISKVIF